MDVSIINFVFPFSKPMPPLGVLSLCNALKRANYTFEFLDYQIHNAPQPKTIKTITKFLLLSSSNILAISCQCYQLPWLLLALKECSQELHDKTIILGGIGPSTTAKAIMDKYPVVDFILSGEGEVTFPLLIDTIKKDGHFDNIDGLFWRDHRHVRCNPHKCRITNLDSIPVLDVSPIDVNDYFLLNLTSSRGCTYQCSFCSLGPYWDYSLSAYSIDCFINEIERLNINHGVNKFAFIDDTFVINRERTISICKRLIEKNLEIEWSCYGRLNQMDENLMKYMVDAGCQKIFYGFESGSQNVLDKIMKKNSVDKAIATVELSQKYFKYVLTSFFWGSPVESYEEFLDTVYLVLYFVNNGFCVEFNQYIPYPNSPLTKAYKQLLKFDPKRTAQLMNQYYSRKQQKVIQEPCAEEIIQEITKFQDIFSPFYYIDTSDFDKKYDLVQQMGINPDSINAAWEGFI